MISPKNLFAVILLAAASLTHAQSVTSGWRLIPEDPNFPSDDAIAAFCEVTDPIYGLPTNTETTDCTAAIQAALDDTERVAGKIGKPSKPDRYFEKWLGNFPSIVYR